jgi:archaemetzincin
MSRSLRERLLVWKRESRVAVAALAAVAGLMAGVLVAVGSSLLGPPGANERARADVERIRAAHFAAGGYQDELFERLPAARPDDSRYDHLERGQTFEEFVALQQVLPTATAERIVFQPLEPFAERDRARVEPLCVYLAEFFVSDVKIAPAMEIPPEVRREARMQGDLRAIVDYLAEQRRTGGLMCLGIGSRDAGLAGLPFAFGPGDARLRTAACSVAHVEGDLRRAKKMLAHATGHALGMLHCIFYRCLMNGCSSRAELDAEPDDLCPVCLRKLVHGRAIDLAWRYDALGDARRAAWLRARGVNRFW